jgi:glycosyltransferase involved in cell wall biosynthesis
MKQGGEEPRVVFSFLSIGHYRREPMRLVLDHFGSDLQIFAGRFAVDRSIRTLGPSELPIRTLPTFSWGERIVFQIVPLITYLKAPVLLADLNPRALHLWPILAARRLLGKPTILWGAAWPRRGQNSRTTPVRLAMVRLANSVIIYTRQQASELKATMPEVTVTAAPNSLYRVDQCGFTEDRDRKNFIYVGRIVAEKKVDLLVKAFALFSTSCDDVSLLVVGDGTASDEMRELANQHGISHRVEFLGHIEDVDALKNLYSTCIAAVSPGYVGLAATQAYSFGVPMIIADAEPHSPEIEAVKPLFNARFFVSDSAPDLAAAMEEMVLERDYWDSQGSAIVEECCRSYSAEAMASGVIRAVNAELGTTCAEH